MNSKLQEFSELKEFTKKYRLKPRLQRNKLNSRQNLIFKTFSFLRKKGFKYDLVDRQERPGARIINQRFMVAGISSFKWIV